MNYEEIYQQSYNDELEKIAERDKNEIAGGWFRPDISALERDYMPGNIYLSE